ncbi:MAG: hypothetical protein U0132_22720 [Gemmatimonadaceae bacterium]
MQRHSFRRAAAFAVCVAAVACSKKESAPPAETTPAAAPAPAPPPAPAVTAIDLGHTLGANSRVTDTASVFKVRDTMYVSVVTEHATSASSLTAKWTFQTGQLVDSTTQALARTDSVNTTAVTEFHITKKTPWPVGKYKVEIWFDGKSAGSKDFEVKK